MSDSIVSAEVIVSSPARNYVTLKITTADGVVGLIAVWLHRPEHRDPAEPLALVGRLMPSWWPSV